MSLILGFATPVIKAIISRRKSQTLISILNVNFVGINVKFARTRKFVRSVIHFMKLYFRMKVWKINV